MNIKETNNWRKVRARLFKMVSVGVIDDPINQGYDVISTGALIINLAVSVMATFDFWHRLCAACHHCARALSRKVTRRIGGKILLLRGRCH